ncbi:hypothetical protein DFH28DRAFT_946785 [Melampsora americana]|nr:hypothetical protein DFH28DRAFT_946785 [Melampsora americana]
MSFNSLVDTFWYPEKIITCQNPSYITILYLIPFWLQCSLLHPNFSNHSSLRLIRRFLFTPLNVYLGIKIPIDFCFKPLTKNASLNLHFGIAGFYLALKSLEWGLTGGFLSGKYWDVIESDQSKKKVDQENLTVKEKTWKEVAIWTTNQFFSVRGLQYGWGVKTNLVTPSVLGVMRRYFLVHLLNVISLIPLMLTRDHGCPDNALASLGIPSFWGRMMIAEGIATISSMIFTFSGIDMTFSIITLGCYGLHWLNQSIQIPQWILDLCDPKLCPPIFEFPNTQTKMSLAWFWGKGWHQLLRRVFLVCGATPTSKLVKKFGGSSLLQKIVGLFGTFFLSGLLHQYAIHCVSRQPHPNPHIYFNEFPGTFFYFFIQPIGLIIEPFIIPRIPRYLGGGWLWVLIFTAITCSPYRKQFIDSSRFIDENYKPLSEWSWSTLIFPGKYLK